MNIFACYSSRDKAKVDVVLNALRARSHEIWDYNKEALPGPILDELAGQFERSSAILLFLSKNFMASKFCKHELRMASTAYIESDKIVIPVLLDGTKPDAILGVQQRVDLRVTKKVTLVAAKVVELIEAGSRSASRTGRDSPPSGRSSPAGKSRRARGPFKQDILSSPRKLADIVLAAAKSSRWAEDLIPPSAYTAPSGFSVQEEGLVLIKPGGTFHRPCLEEIFSRLSRVGTIRQIRVINGPSLARKKLFEKQYCAPSKLASGQMPLDEPARAEIRRIYGVPAFKEDFGERFEDVPVVPALHLTHAPYGLSAELINQIWEEGRSPQLWRNQKHNGMNKIGYQKTVFPFPPASKRNLFPGLPCCIILNGFIPALKHLFERPEAVTVAIHVQTSRNGWDHIRENIVGSDNDPAGCHKGSIRHDALHGGIPLNLRDPILKDEHHPVNGQRNVCHSSGNLLDGFRELSIWFGLRPEETVIGSLLNAQGIPWSDDEFEDTEFLEYLANSRRYKLQDLLSDSASIRASDILHEKQKPYTEKRFEEIARECNVNPGSLYANEQAVYLINNGLRLDALGEEMFHGFVLEHLVRQKFFPLYKQTLESIRRRAASHRPPINPDVLALAYMIAASDIKFLNCRAYAGDGKGLELFKNRVCASLPEEALECAWRTWNNMLGEIKATLPTHLVPVSAPVRRIRDEEGWDDVELVSVETGASGLSVQKDLAVIVLAGGRSTRTCSTIPKALLPIGQKLMIESILETARAAGGPSTDLFIACGFRLDLIESAIARPDVHFIKDGRLKGLGFRLLAALVALARQGYEGKKVLVAYTDMPNISQSAAAKILDRVRKPRDFAFLTTYNRECSGHVELDAHDRPVAIIQKRLHPNRCHDNMLRDAGVYAFHNTPELRKMISSIANRNVKIEYTFADIVEILARNKGWELATVAEEHANCTCVNTAAELLLHAIRLDKVGGLPAAPAAALEHYYGLRLSDKLDASCLKPLSRIHRGPFFFFDWWERIWA